VTATLIDQSWLQGLFKRKKAAAKKPSAEDRRTAS